MDSEQVEDSEFSQQQVGEIDQEPASEEGPTVADTSDETKGGETYSEYDARRDSYEGSRGVSHGQGCTVNCGGHNAGYTWAEEHGITSADQCGGKSWSFDEGCRSYAEEQSGSE
jgi:hypothetical protein